jgi:signal transduction histidine kinase
MYADLLAESLRQSDDELESNRQLDKVSIIQNESQRLSRLINNVLQFARPLGNQRTLQLELAVIDDIVRDVVASFRPRLESLGFEIQLDLAVTERRSLDADAVEQILINLVSNSEKYAAGGKWLSIITRSSDEQVEILVTDRGPGIPPRFAEKIFDPFVRISDRIESPAGTGIGLAIVRQLARLHGGDCRLVASQGGACFSCILHAKSDRPR